MRARSTESTCFLNKLEDQNSDRNQTKQSQELLSQLYIVDTYHDNMSLKPENPAKLFEQQVYLSAFD